MSLAACLRAYLPALLPAQLSAAALLVAQAVAAPAMAAVAGQNTVWRCGPEGARTYSDVPCAGGGLIEAADPRSAQQVAQGRQVLADDMRRAESMRRERLEREARERAAQPAAAAAIKPAGLRQPPARPQAKEAKPRPPRPQAKTPPLKRSQRPGSEAAADDGTWRAVAPSSPRAPG